MNKKHRMSEEHSWNGTRWLLWVYCSCGWSDGPLPNQKKESRRSFGLHVAQLEYVDSEPEDDELYGFSEWDEFV